MTLTQVAIPPYDRRTGKGNWNPPDGTVKDTLLFHEMNGWLSGTISTFKNANTVHSAQYGIGTDQVVQFVSNKAISFSAGDYSWNQRCIALEHQGGNVTDGSGRVIQAIPFEDAMYENSAQTVAAIARSEGHPVSWYKVKRHRDIISTPCSGDLDVERIMRRALEIEAASQGDVQVPSVPPIPATQSSATVSIPVTTDFWIRTAYPVHFRNGPGTSYPVYATYSAGSEIECDGQATGESVAGNTTWYRSKGHGKFVTAAYAAIINKPSNA